MQTGYMTDIIHKINWVDCLVVILMLRTSYIAFQHGLSHEIFPLFGSCLMMSVALRYYTTIAALFEQHILKLPPVILNLFSFVAILLGLGMACKIVGALLDHLIKVTWHPFVERFGGLLIGVVKASIVTSMVIIVLALIPLSYLQHSIRDRSVMGMRFMKIGPNIYGQALRFLPALPGEKSVATKDEVMRLLLQDKSLNLGAHKAKVPEII